MDILRTIITRIITTVSRGTDMTAGMTAYLVGENGVLHDFFYIITYKCKQHFHGCNGAKWQPW